MQTMHRPIRLTRFVRRILQPEWATLLQKHTETNKRYKLRNIRKGPIAPKHALPHSEIPPMVTVELNSTQVKKCLIFCHLIARFCAIQLSWVSCLGRCILILNMPQKIIVRNGLKIPTAVIGRCDYSTQHADETCRTGRKFPHQLCWNCRVEWSHQRLFGRFEPIKRLSRIGRCDQGLCIMRHYFSCLLRSVQRHEWLLV